MYRHIEVREIFVDVWDLYSCVQKFREIITSEHEAGNHVYVNVSTGTKITAIAGMLACMLWNATPYYAPLSYSNYRIKPDVSSVEQVGDTVVQPVFEAREPKLEALVVLGLIERSGGSIRKKQLIRELEQIGVIKLRDEAKTELTEAAKHSQLRALLDPMQNEWGYVKIEASGRHSTVSLTEKGKTALKIFGT